MMSEREELKKIYYVLDDKKRVMGISDNGDEDKFFAEIASDILLKDVEDSLGIKDKYIEFDNGSIIEKPKQELDFMESIDEKIALAISEVVEMIINNEET